MFVNGNFYSTSNSPNACVNEISKAPVNPQMLVSMEMSIAPVNPQMFVSVKFLKPQ